MVEHRQRKKRTRENIVQGIRKGRTFGRRRRVQPECNNGIRDRDVKEQLRLRKKRTDNGIRGRNRKRELRLGSVKTYETLGQTVELEVMKRAVGTSIRQRKMSVRTLWKGRPPPKRKNTHTSSFRGGAINVRPFTTLGNVGHANRWETIAINVDLLAPYDGTAWDEHPYGGSSANGWRVNTSAKPSHGKEEETDHRSCKHSPWRRNGGRSVGNSGPITLRREQCSVGSCCYEIDEITDFHY
jgi:hypothetical protein